MHKKLIVTSVKQETPESCTYFLEPLDGWIPSYKAGQFLTLIFKTKHGEKRRSYSLSSSPGEPMAITVKKLDNGEFSRFILKHAVQGTILNTGGISGFFILPPQPKKFRYCFIAAGSGITPCFSLIKQLVATTNCDISLIYSNKSKTDAIFFRELTELAERNSRLKIKFLFSDSDDLYSKRLSKWLLDQLLDRLYGKVTEDVRFYICGPFEYMQTVEITLRSRALAENIIKENYSALPRLVLPVPPDTAGHVVTILSGDITYTVNVKFPTTILAACKAAGIDIPYSCEAGRCGSCVATCVNGKVWMAYNEVLVEKEVLKGRILTCQGFPVFGEATIQL